MSGKPRPLSWNIARRLHDAVRDAYPVFRGEGLVSYFEVISGDGITAYFYIEKGSNEYRNRILRSVVRRVCKERGWRMYEDSFQIVIIREQLSSDTTLGELYRNTEETLETAAKSLEKKLRSAVKSWHKTPLH